MQWAKDLQDEVGKLIKKFEELSQKVDRAVKESASNSRENANNAKYMTDYNSKAENLAEELKRLKNEFPKSLPPVKHEYGINLETKIWLIIVLLGSVLGFVVAPQAIQTAEVKILEHRQNQLIRREFQIKEFQKVHPKFTEKYFPD